MADILIRAFCFVAIIVTGYVLRLIGVFKKEDFNVISRIVIKLTIASAIITSFAGKTLDASFMIYTVIGFGFGALMMAVAYLVNIHRGKEMQAFAILNSSGCSVGTFVLPFATNFLGPAGVLVASFFDIGNSFICLGGSYGIACAVKENNKKFSIMPIVKALGKSVPFIAYVVLIIMALLHISIPRVVLEYTGIIGDANAFLAMFMVGVGFDLSGKESMIPDAVRTLLPRYIVGITLAVLSFNFLPVQLEYRQALVILFLAPLPSAAPAFTIDMHSDYGLSSAINSIAIIISIALSVTGLLIVM